MLLQIVCVGGDGLTVGRKTYDFKAMVIPTLTVTFEIVWICLKISGPPQYMCEMPHYCNNEEEENEEEIN